MPRQGYKVNKAFIAKYGDDCSECREPFFEGETAWLVDPFDSFPICECCDEDQREKAREDYYWTIQARQLSPERKPLCLSASWLGMGA